MSEINEFLYCPRRLYYFKFYDYHYQSYELIDGTLKHENSSTRGNWIKKIFLKSENLGIKGEIDVIKNEHLAIPVERKRSKKGKYYKNDEYQLVAYCLLLEENIDEEIPYGYIYLYSTDRKHKIKITKVKRKNVKEIINKIKKMDIDKIPKQVDNSNKCKKCSVRNYCMPKESEKLGEVN